MSRPLRVIFSLALLIPAASSLLAGAQHAETARHAADEAAIKAVVDERWMAGWNAHDPHQFSSMFANDADFTMSVDKAHPDKPTLRSFTRRLLNGFSNQANPGKSPRFAFCGLILPQSISVGRCRAQSTTPANPLLTALVWPIAYSSSQAETGWSRSCTAPN